MMGHLNRIRGGRWAWSLAVLVGATGLALPLTAEQPSSGDSPGPEYDAQGNLLRPEGYERWVFVGTSLGLNYIEGDVRPGPRQFHNVYLPAAAFDYFVEHGEFPERTVFVMTNSPASQNEGPALINRHGHFAGRSLGLEVAVKDATHFDDGWGYFIFPSATGPRTSAKAFDRESCYDCHAEHGKTDNVFLQFYSVLDAARERRQATDLR